MEATRTDVFHVLAEGRLEEKVTPASRWHFPTASKAACPATAADQTFILPEARTEGRERKAANPRATEEFTLLFRLVCRRLRHERFLQRPGNSLAKKIKASHNICVKLEPHLEGF